MKLTENFSLAELTKSQTATRLGFENKPNQMQVLALTKLCENVLQPVRNKFEMPVFISSGFRSARLSEAIGSSSKSQHCKGQAADIEIFGVDNFQFIVIDKSSCDIGISNYVSKDFIKSGRDKVAYALKVYHDYFETEMTDLDAYYIDINL